MRVRGGAGAMNRTPTIVGHAGRRALPPAIEGCSAAQGGLCWYPNGRAASSVRQSRGLLIPWSRVRISGGPPANLNLRTPRGVPHPVSRVASDGNRDSIPHGNTPSELTLSQRRALIALRLVLDEAAGRTRRGATYVDRVIASLLSGLAVENTVRLLSEEPVEYGTLKKRIGQIAGGAISRRNQTAARRAWNTRVNVQHEGFAPPEESDVAEIVDGSRAFAREAVTLVLRTDLEAAGLASAVTIAPLRDALARVEQAFADEEWRTAAEWISRALYRLERLVRAAHHGSGTSDHMVRVVGRAMRERITGLNQDLDALYLSAVLGINPLELDRLRAELPRTWTADGAEATHFMGSEPTPEALRRHYSLVIRAAFQLEQSGAVFEAKDMSLPPSMLTTSIGQGAI